MTDDIDMALDLPAGVGAQVAEELTTATRTLDERLRNDRMWLMSSTGERAKLISQLDKLVEAIALAKEASVGADRLEAYTGKSEMDRLREQLTAAQAKLKQLEERHGYRSYPSVKY